MLKYDFPDSLVYDETSGKYVTETPEYGVTDIRYNVEQDNYMWYLRKSLVLPDVRLSQLQQGAQKEMEGKGSKATKKKGFIGFFKNLFKKKEKVPTDTTKQQVPPKPADDFDYIENDSIRQHQQDSVKEAQPPQKKGAFSFLKKKKKDDAANDDAETEEQKPKKKRKEEKPKDDVVPPPEDEPIIEEDDEETESF